MTYNIIKEFTCFAFMLFSELLKILTTSRNVKYLKTYNAIRVQLYMSVYGACND